MAWLSASSTITMMERPPRNGDAADTTDAGLPAGQKKKAGRLAIAVTTKNAAKLRKNTDDARLIARPIRKSPWAKLVAGNEASVIGRPFDLTNIISGIGRARPRPNFVAVAYHDRDRNRLTRRL